ncbi:MAG TPA: MarR family transcriptional regulator [Alphaproteobacteria bacterium]|nr:MarR family transcriptional regulator [Alphaproteobacteria bacterium]
MLGYERLAVSRISRGLVDIKSFHDTIDVADLLVRLAQIVRSRRHSGGLRPVQWEILRYLSHANRISRCPGFLALYLGTTRGTVSQTLITLEKKGLITRERNAFDGRGTLLNLTAKGRRTAASDPLQELRTVTESMTGGAALGEGLRDLLGQMQKLGDLKPFGVCRDCGHFHQEAEADRDHFCDTLNEPVSEEDTHLICLEFNPEAT